jgi:hypothetical protein
VEAEVLVAEVVALVVGAVEEVVVVVVAAAEVCRILYTAY